MKPKWSKALWNDGYLGMSWIAFSVLTVFLILQLVGVFPSEEYTCLVFSGLMALMAISFLWRLAWILRLFRNGKIIDGIVDKISIYRDRGVITFFFILGETFVKTKQPIMRNKNTQMLTPGLKVRILYDEKRLKRALIVALYSETESVR